MLKTEIQTQDRDRLQAGGDWIQQSKQKFTQLNDGTEPNYTQDVTTKIDFIKLCVIFGVLSHPLIMTLNNYIDFIHQVINQFRVIGYDDNVFSNIQYGLALGCIVSRSLCNVSNEGILCGSFFVDVEAKENFILQAIPHLGQGRKEDKVNFDKIIEGLCSPKLN